GREARRARRRRLDHGGHRPYHPPRMTRRIVFVTGGAGFIGSNIVARLAEDRTLDVVVCDRLREVELGKWRNIAKHPIGDFVAPEAMFDWLEKRWRDVE